ncbi:MAG: polysaccharide deacetylase family protein [Firmicutes bacterium]|nr:polysaccharide deacetylase family protein [Bacillota bacterium]
MKEKHRMTSGQWLVAFVLTVVLLGLSVLGFNYITDPFGAFGDRFFQWWSYDETMNPRVAKIEYLEQNHELYDSYIIGCSSTSSWPVEGFNEYFDARFYNMIMYGADMLDVELMSKYLIEHYEVKNLVVNIYINNAEEYNTESDPLTYNLNYKVDGTSRWDFYKKYLFLNPRYGLEKLKKYRNDSYLQAAHDVFDEATGAYDKSRRDVENISDLETYFTKAEYKAFVDYPQRTGHINNLEPCMESMRAIKEVCEENGVNLMVVCPPVYYKNLEYYTQEQVAAFNRALAEVTDYWDFTMSSVSFEPRYFYDKTHFRNCVGDMAVAKISGDDSVYVPGDFGHFVTADNVDQVLETYWEAEPLAEDELTAKVPILMYHHLAETGDGGDIISVEDFESHMATLTRAGYTAVDFDDLKSYVEQGVELPEKPVVITFDDGYESNLTLAYPILKRYGMKATVFAIGVSIGKDTYKDTGESMIPHFSLEEAALCADAITVGSHGYNIHEVAGRDPEPIRQGVLQKESETEEEYIQFLRNDCEAMDALFEEALGRTPQVLAYPFGWHTTLSDLILKEEGIWATVTSDVKINIIIKGIPQSLYAMGRLAVRGSYTADQVLEMLKTGQRPQ